MNFNSPTFFVFLAVVFLLYWRMHRKEQNMFLLFCSYLFYAWWDWRFLSLIIISSATDFIVGKKLFSAQTRASKKRWLLVSILVNLSLLGFFKYFNFFIESLRNLLLVSGFSEVSLTTLHIILPVGISFYTFQTLSYSIELYQGKIRPTRDWVQFFVFISFFPQLVAGPIERASHLLGQFKENRVFDLAKAYDGVRQILWGLFKKAVIADNLATVVELAYGHTDTVSGPQLLAATFFFAFQIYCDFSGYSDIAIGTARLFGIDLSRNFRYPYFSKNISEFWRRWHITLTSWFQDFIFVPLYMHISRVGRIARFAPAVRHTISFYIATIAGLLLLGLWHGAAWTFIVFGFSQAVCIIIYHATKKYWDRMGKFLQIPLTFCMVLVGFIFFRAQSLSEALNIFSTIASDSSLEVITIFFAPMFVKKTIMAVLFVFVEWRQRAKEHVLRIEKVPVLIRWGIYYAIILCLFLLGNYDYHPFIYFQF